MKSSRKVRSSKKYSRKTRRHGGVKTPMPSELVGKIASYIKDPVSRTDVAQFAEPAYRPRVPLPNLNKHEGIVFVKEITNDMERINTLSQERNDLIREKLKIFIRMVNRLTSPQGIRTMESFPKFKTSVIHKIFGEGETWLTNEVPNSMPEKETARALIRKLRIELALPL